MILNNFLLYLLSSISQMVFRYSSYFSFRSCVIPFQTFWMFLIIFKRIETIFCVTFNWSASSCWVWVSSSSNKAYNSLSLNVFGDFPRSSFLTSKSPTHFLILISFSYYIYAVFKIKKKYTSLFKLLNDFGDDIRKEIILEHKNFLNIVFCF